jgi:hypothetical protein
MKFYCWADEKATKRLNLAVRLVKHKGPAPEKRSRAFVVELRSS